MTHVETNAADLVLTREDLAALRGADGVVFKITGGVTGAQGVLVAHQEHSRDAVWSGDAPRSREIAVAARLEVYSGGADVTGASWSISAAQYHPEWRSLLRTLRVGDVITIQITGANDSEVLRGAGLSADELRVLRHRAGQPVATFLLEYVVAPVRSAGRMLHH